MAILEKVEVQTSVLQKYNKLYIHIHAMSTNVKSTSIKRYVSALLVSFNNVVFFLKLWIFVTLSFKNVSTDSYDI